METLIPIKTDNGKQVISARELHFFLESKQDFTTWIKSRIEKYDFVEGVEFTLHKFVERGTWKHEYAISLDMAKELAMVEGNEKGKIARRYFIECEKKMKDIFSSALPDSQPKLIALPIKSIAEKRKEIQSELMQTIKLNLNKGDLKSISERENIPYHKICKVMSSTIFDYDIIYLLYERAKNNLMFLETEVKILSEDLKNLSA